MGACRGRGGPMNLAVAIVNYRSAGLVIEGLPALMAELAGFARAMVVIVDNASPDDDADRLEAFLQGFAAREAVRLIRSPRNGGFAAGNNLAFAAIAALDWRADAVMLLNPDAMVRPGALAALARTLADRPQAGVAGATLENDDGTVRGSAFRFPSAMGEFARNARLGPLMRLWPVLAETGPGPTRVDWVTGAAMMVRTDALEALAGMDEGYFLYYEEVDFMRRASLAGWEVWTVPAARVTHRAGSSTGIVGGVPRRGPMPGYWYRSWRRYFEKNHGPQHARVAALMAVLGMLAGALADRIRGRRHRLPPGFLQDFARACLLGRPLDPAA